MFSPFEFVNVYLNKRNLGHQRQRKANVRIYCKTDLKQKYTHVNTNSNGENMSDSFSN